MDRRFVAGTRQTFQQLTGLKEAEYYHEAFAGGALGQPPATDGADYVYNKVNGTDATLVYMGWQVHLDHCGGLPGLENDQIVDKFRRLILAGTLQNKYPSVPHIFLAKSLAAPPNPVPAATTLVFDSTGVQYNTWCHVFYRDLNGQLFMWDSGQFSPSQVQITVPGGATNICLEGGAIGGSAIFSGTNATPNSIFYAYAGTASLPGGTVTFTLSGSASAPSYTSNPTIS